MNETFYGMAIMMDDPDKKTIYIVDGKAVWRRVVVHWRGRKHVYFRWPVAWGLHR